MRRTAPAAVAAAALLPGCGAPDELSEREGRTLAAARERLDDALDTEETLRTSRTEARALRRAVQRIVSDGSFERPTLDEFGLARLGELQEVVPSLVIVDSRGSVRTLDRRATADFLRFAERDAARALLRPARRQVDAMVRTLDEAGADGGTEIPLVRQNADAYLREAERDVKDIWPALSTRLASVLRR